MEKVLFSYPMSRIGFSKEINIYSFPQLLNKMVAENEDAIHHCALVNITIEDGRMTKEVDVFSFDNSKYFGDKISFQEAEDIFWNTPAYWPLRYVWSNCKCEFFAYNKRTSSIIPGTKNIIPEEALENFLKGVPKTPWDKVEEIRNEYRYHMMYGDMLENPVVVETFPEAVKLLLSDDKYRGIGLLNRRYYINGSFADDKEVDMILYLDTVEGGLDEEGVYFFSKENFAELFAEEETEEKEEFTPPEEGVAPLTLVDGKLHFITPSKFATTQSFGAKAGDEAKGIKGLASITMNFSSANVSIPEVSKKEIMERIPEDLKQRLCAFHVELENAEYNAKSFVHSIPVFLYMRK